MKFEIYKDRKGEWRWRLLATNSNIVACSGEGYSKKFNCTRIVQSIIANVRAGRCKLKTA